MRDFGKHVCMLPAVPGVMMRTATPAAGFCRRLMCRMRALLLAAQWHHAVSQFMRSRKSLALEQARQLNTAHWATWHPYSPVKFGWDCLAFTINCITFIYMPLQVFIPCSSPHDPLVLLSDFVALCEVLVNFFTGKLDKNEKCVILEQRAIIKAYLKSSFIYDVIAALPLQVIQPFAKCEYPSHTAMYVFKLLRVLSIRRTWQNIHRQFSTPYMFTHALSMFAWAVLFFHWGTYLHFQVPALCAHLYDSGPYVKEWLVRQKVAPAYSATLLEKYLKNLFRLASLAIGAGLYDPAQPPVIPELLLTAALGMLGLLFVMYILTAIFRLVIYAHFEIYLYNGRLRELQEYLIFKRVPRFLLKKVQLFINYKFNGRYFNEESILNTLNDQIRMDMNLYYCKHLVLNVPLFQDLPMVLLNMFIFKLKQLLYMPGELVVKCGHPGSSIYLIASGTVGIINSQGQEVGHLIDGAFFGEKELLNPGTPRSDTIIALEITEIYKLSSKEFQECLQLCPRMGRRLAPRPPHRGDAVLNSQQSFIDDTR